VKVERVAIRITLCVNVERHTYMHSFMHTVFIAFHGQIGVLDVPRAISGISSVARPFHVRVVFFFYAHRAKKVIFICRNYY
jgi:hypothetical protein